MLVADQIYDRFVERFVARTEALVLGPGHEWTTDVGSLISQYQLDTVTAHVEDAVAKGAKVLAGGKARPALGLYFYEPRSEERRGGKECVSPLSSRGAQ